jgi:hypothetical protein
MKAIKAIPHRLFKVKSNNLIQNDDRLALPKHLSGGWLPLARLIWICLSATTVIIFAISAIALYQGTLTPCLSIPEKDQTLCYDWHQQLAQLNMSVNFYATSIVVGVMIEILPWLIVGVVIFWKKSRELFSFLFSLMLMLWGITVLDQGISTWFPFVYPSYGWLLRTITFVANLLTLTWLLFPDGSFKPRWLHWAALIWILRIGVYYFFPGNPVDPDTWPSPLPQAISILFVLLLLFSLVYRYRFASNPAQRQQIKWVVTGGLIYGITYIISNNLFPFSLQEMLARLIWLPFFYGASFFFAVCLGFSILRYRLWDIDVIIRRTLVYGGLTITLAAIYLVGVFLLQGLFQTLSGQKSVAAIVISTLVIAALFNPLRKRIQNDIDRRFYRRKYDAQKTLIAFNATLRNNVDLENLCERLIDVIHETMQPGYISFWISPMSSQRGINFKENEPR